MDQNTEAQSDNHEEPTGTLIRFDDIHSYEHFLFSMATVLSNIEHIFKAHWEITPESSSEMTNNIADMMKAIAATYHRGIEEGWITPDKQYVQDSNPDHIRDVHDNQ